MGKTVLKDEISQRLDYFEDWLEKLGRDEGLVVNRKTAKDYIRNAFGRDPSLSNLADAMDEQPGSYEVLVDSGHVQGLIEKNREEQAEFNKAVRSLKTKRVDLEKAIGKKRTDSRRRVIRKVMTKEMSKKYNINRSVDKKGVIRYRDNKGKFLSNNALLRVADRVIATSAKTRREVEALLEKDYLGKKK